MSDSRVTTIAALAAGAMITGALAGPAALAVAHGSAAAPVLPPVAAAPTNLVIPPMPTTTTEDAEKDPYRVSPAQAAAAAAAAAAPVASSSAPVATSPPSAPIGTTTPVSDSGPAPIQPGSSSDFGVGGIDPVSGAGSGPTSSPAPPTTPTTQPPTGTTSPSSSTCTVSMTSNPDQADPNLYDLTVDVITEPQLGNSQYNVTISTAGGPNSGQLTQHFGPYTTDNKGLDSETVKVPTTMMATAAQSQQPLTADVAFQHNGPSCSASYTTVQVPAG